MPTRSSDPVVRLQLATILHCMVWVYTAPGAGSGRSGNNGCLGGCVLVGSGYAFLHTFCSKLLPLSKTALLHR